MFDPFFALALVCGPFALAALLAIEAQRTTRKSWLLGASLVLAIPAVWGLSYWVLLVSVVLFGEGMTEAGFRQAMLFSVGVAILIVVASYCWVVHRRKQRVGT